MISAVFVLLFAFASGTRTTATSQRVTTTRTAVTTTATITATTTEAGVVLGRKLDVEQFLADNAGSITFKDSNKGFFFESTKRGGLSWARSLEGTALIPLIDWPLRPIVACLQPEAASALRLKHVTSETA